MSAYLRKTKDEYILQGNYGYGHGWEDLTAAGSIVEIRQYRKEYRENEPGTPLRIIKRRVPQRDPKRYSAYPGVSRGLRGKTKIRKVMEEFETGKLRSSSGQRVTNPRQAVAIALSEQRRQESSRLRRDRPVTRRPAVRRDSGCSCKHSPAVRRDLVNYPPIAWWAEFSSGKGGTYYIGPYADRKVAEQIGKNEVISATQGGYPGGSSRITTRAPGPHDVRFHRSEAESEQMLRLTAVRAPAYPPLGHRAKRKLSKKRSVQRDPRKVCSIGTEVQTVVLSQQFFNVKQAESWVRRHGFRVSKIDETVHNYRFRQHPPTNFKEGSFRTIRLRPGVEAVIACPR